MGQFSTQGAHGFEWMSCLDIVVCALRIHLNLGQIITMVKPCHAYAVGPVSLQSCMCGRLGCVRVTIKPSACRDTSKSGVCGWGICVASACALPKAMCKVMGACGNHLSKSRRARPFRVLAKGFAVVQYASCHVITPKLACV